VTRTLITRICVLTFVALQASAIHIWISLCCGHVCRWPCDPKASDWLVGETNQQRIVCLPRWQSAAALAG